MPRLRHKLVLFLAAAALPFWVNSSRETVAALGQATLISLQQDDRSPSLSLLRWRLDLSAEQDAALDRLLAEAAPLLRTVAAETDSARMAAALTAVDAPAASRRQRELATAEAQLIHEQRLLERRLRAQLTPEQVAKVERWETNARNLDFGLSSAIAMLSPGTR